jgi:hypothetical protein
MTVVARPALVLCAALTVATVHGQPAAPCTDMMSMQAGWMAGVMDECCNEPTEDCSGGFPVSCNTAWYV